jgi:hypothetical protein
MIGNVTWQLELLRLCALAGTATFLSSTLSFTTLTGLGAEFGSVLDFVIVLDL